MLKAILEKVDWDRDGFVTGNDTDEAQCIISRLAPEVVAGIEDQIAAAIGSVISAALVVK